MDYTTTDGYVVDALGRRQLANRDLLNGIRGTDARCDDLQNVVNTLMDLIEGAGLSGDASDDTLVVRAIRRIAGYSAPAWTTISSSTVLTVPAWATRMEIWLTGAGGGGCGCQAAGDSQSYSGAGGAAGATAHFTATVTGGAVVNFIIGAPGDGGVSSGGSPGNGGASTVSVAGVLIATAQGGQGGRWAGISSSAGGIGGGVTFSDGLIDTGMFGGGDGGDGQASVKQLSGNGGTSYWGGGGRAGALGGLPATAPGAGGGGAYDVNYTENSYNGGAGALGLAMVRFLP